MWRSPADAKARALWLQHVAGHILLRDLRAYAQERVEPGLSPEAQRAGREAIDDTLYGLIMDIDGVSSPLESDQETVSLRVAVELVRDDGSVDTLDLAEGDGMCMGLHGWLEGDFGEHPVVAR